MPSEPLRLALVGYGKMGRVLDQLAPGMGLEVVLKLDEHNNKDGTGLTAENFRGVDVAIDFSIPAVVANNAVRLAEIGVDTVVGTTGWLGEIDRVQAAVEQAGTGFVHGANFSIGVNAFYRIVAAASEIFRRADEYDAAAWEAHHKMKKDAPSGTMLRLLDVMRESGFDRPIDVAHNRVGYVPGTHQISFDSEADTIELRHTARSRVGFARGALRAARWVHGRKGFYEFSAIWEQTLGGAG
ncbi:MAG: dihydrodipicolinate reductase [Bryobacterales bacterium]|nr:dihydrodipicolinate reductase [Bryobacterales bacterium]